MGSKGCGWDVVGITPEGRRYRFPTVITAVQVLHCSESALRKALTPNKNNRREYLGAWRWAYLKELTANENRDIRDYTEMSVADIMSFELMKRMRPSRSRATENDKEIRSRLAKPVKHDIYKLRRGMDHVERERIMEARAEAEKERELRKGETGAVYRWGYIADGFPMLCPVCGRIVAQGQIRHYEECTTAPDIPADRIHLFDDNLIRLRVDGWTVPPRDADPVNPTKCLTCRHYRESTHECMNGRLCRYKSMEETEDEQI